MKTILLSLIFAFFISQNYAQCSESATNFGNNNATSAYNVSGDVTVTLNTNNTVTLNLGSNFQTSSGPDVRAYYVNSNGRTTAELNNTLINDLENIRFGTISFSGAQSFTATIPEETEVKDFDTVFFYCIDFNIYWDSSSIKPFNNATCDVLSTENIEFTRIKIYPNPATNKIQISNIDGNSTKISIFNVLGKQVFHQVKILENTIDISSFNKGIYLVKIDIDGKSKTQKLVIR
jgi:hypothetical protein